MEKVQCNCGKWRPPFAITGDTCDICNVDITREANKGKPVKVVAADVVAKAKKLLGASDWTQMPDVRKGKPEQWSPYREGLRVVIDSMKNGEDPNKVVWPEVP